MDKFASTQQLILGCVQLSRV